ncbi:enolase C-terminal domain-like protein [Streptomyces sp. TS71-3]|uniref:enolase C-terminal domain-like protein n=1 Tax=Streptomyces sp. TS71-3 TaxID=2733862 RepID=UPI001B2B6CE8|nr:enolase C-terminal domain-like protein [Streptomyces sp. TS71-3]GHJ40917.1 mandelate racemase [Streptomyces sp. TS71-3]
MRDDLTIRRVVARELEWTMPDLAPDRTGLNHAYRPGARSTNTGYVVTVETAGGVTGEYSWSQGGKGVSTAQIAMVARYLIGRNALHRERIWNDVKRALRKQDRFGLGPLDIALWDIAGKSLGAPVHELLGTYRTALPAYASTHFGDEHGGLDSPAAFADFAVRCRELGYPGFKIHGWGGGPIAREVEAVLATRAAVGPAMDLMIDPACEYETFADALKVGRACDEAGYFWYEDPYRDGGVSSFAHRKLRQLIRTPLLLGEHVRGLEAHVDQILAEGTDFVRADPDYDGGITGVMKIAHAAEGLGLDVEIHAAGPAQRHCMAAIRNTNYYELALVGPKLDPKSSHYHAYADGYADDLTSVDAEGRVHVPEGPGLGVTLNWEWIRSSETGVAVYE